MSLRTLNGSVRPRAYRGNLIGKTPTSVTLIENFDVYALATEDPGNWSFDYSYDTGGIESKAYGVSNTQAQSGTQSYRMQIYTENGGGKARGGNESLKFALGLVPDALTMTASVYIATATSTSYGSGSGFLAHFHFRDTTSKGIYYRMGYGTADNNSKYYNDASFVVNNLKVAAANTLASWVTMTNRDIIADFNGQGWGTLDDLDYISLGATQITGDGGAGGNTGEIDAYFDDFSFTLTI